MTRLNVKDQAELHVGKRAGGENRSPALAWSGTPEGTAQLLLVVQDIDSPTRTPFVHCVALLEPDLVTLPTEALNAGSPAKGVRVLRSGMGRGYLGPEPIKGHGLHRYVFQLFALPTAITSAEGDATLDTAKPRAVLATVSGPALARGRLDGLYTR
jgi:Raf kinase inhibitor-like YbhB/YbcL family protein